MLILEEVELLAELVLVLGKFLENITLTKCTGIIRLYTPISEQSIHIQINYGQLVFVRSKKNDSWEFILQSALLMSTVKFNDRLSKLHICGVDFKLDSHIEVHRNTRNVILDNSYRSVFLDDVTGRKKIIPIEQKDFCLEMSDESSPFNSSDVTRSYESQRLLLKYAHVNNSEFLKSNIKRLEFRNVIVEESCVLQIDDGFEELKLYGCIGKFKIPFVSYESESMIDFHETGCSLEIVKTSISTYNLAIKNMNTSRSISVDACISDLNLQHVAMNEDSVFSLKRTCTNICLSYFKGRIIAPHITALDRLVLSNMNLTTNQFLLSIPTNLLEAKSVVLDHSIVVLGAFAQTMYLRWAKLSTETAIQIISTNNLNNFAFSSIATRIDITSIIRSMENSEPSFLVDGDIKYFSEEGMNGCTTFELRNFQVRAHSELAKNVQFVDLEYVFSDNNSILRLNKEVEYIRITFCQANIDVAMVKELKSAVINCSSFVYDQKIYQSLIYLCISDLTIEQNVYLGENLKTLKLEGVIISRNCTFAISKNISRLHIERSCGMMCMSGVGGFTSLALDCGNTLEYVSVPITRGIYSLRLSNFCFESDIRLSDDIEEVIIEYAKVTNNVKLLLGRECKSVELNTNCINLDNTRASNLQKITLIAISSHVLSQIFSINSLNCLTLEKLNLNSVTKCANHIRTVILRMIDVPEDRIFYVGENCEEFQLLQCNGTFDLSAVKVLRKLVVIPRLNGTMCLKPLHSSLRTVRSLEIAYNFKSSFLQQVLAWCVNIERLTLHGLYYDEAI